MKIAGLSQKETAALQMFSSQLQKIYPQQIQQISLFGSKARGESNTDSDIDVLIITNEEDRSFRHEIIDL